VEIRPVQLDQYSAKALTDAIKRIPTGPQSLADVFGRRSGSVAMAEEMFRKWGASLCSAAATESFVYDCMTAAGFKYDFIQCRYHHPKAKIRKPRPRAKSSS